MAFELALTLPACVTRIDPKALADTTAVKSARVVTRLASKFFMVVSSLYIEIIE
ncbi:hypothetical protein D3C81_1932480 [compost metagenome]